MTSIEFTEILNQLTLLQQNIAVKRLSILLAYLLFALAVDILINRGLRRLANLSRMELDNTIIDAIQRPAFWTVFAIGILHALIIEPFADPWQYILSAIPKVIILISWTVAFLKIFTALLTKEAFELFLRNEISLNAFNMIKKLLRIIIMGLAFLWGLTLCDISLTPLFASAGIAGIAVAMAAKDTLANFFGGMSIFMDNTFRQGDYIVLDSGERGEVYDIGMRSSRIKTRDDILITIPNSILANTKIINESAPIPRFRIRIPVGVAYGTKPDRVDKILMDVARQNSKVRTDPAPRVRFRLLGSSSIDFELLCWVEEPSLKGLVSHELLKDIYTALNREDISIPFPQMDVYLKKTDDPAQ